MNERAAGLRAAITSAMGRSGVVTKAAGAVGAERAAYEAVIDSLCELVGRYEEAVDGFEAHTRYAAKVLKALERPPVPHQMVPFRPDEWRVGLTPNVPPQQVNGNGNGRHGGHDLQE